MTSKILETAQRLKGLREMEDISISQMANALGISEQDYEDYESGKRDFSISFLHNCAKELDVDVVDIITGESPKLSGYTVVRSNEKQPIERRRGFTYNHLNPNFKDKIVEAFEVFCPYSEAEHKMGIPLSTHQGQELDFILEGELDIVVDGHTERLKPGDTMYMNSSIPHGMNAVGKEGCRFIAIVASVD